MEGFLREVDEGCDRKARGIAEEVLGVFGEKGAGPDDKGGSLEGARNGENE